MLACLLTLSESVRETMIRELLFFGVTVKAASHFQEVLQILENNRMNCLILDSDEKEAESLEFIKTLKKEDKYFSLFIILLTSQKDEKKIHDFILAGISGICEKNQDLKNYIKRIQSILLILEQETERRQYIRIQPDIYENIAFLLNKDGVELKGRIRDISVIAAAVVFESGDLFSQVNSGDEIEGLKLSINGQESFINVMVLRKSMEVRRSEDILVLAYKKPSAEFKNLLASYIYQKII